MATSKTYTVQYRRKREGKTDYRTRMNLLVGRKPRLVVRKSSKHVLLQVVELGSKGDKVVASANSKNLEKFGWKASGANTSAAYLTGLLLAKKMKTAVACNVDLGQQRSVKGAILYAAAKGCVDGGLKVEIASVVIPDMKRIRGEHIALYAKMLKTQSKEKYQRQFSRYAKQGVDPESIPILFDKVKSVIGAL